MTRTELIDKMDIACENGTSHRPLTYKAWWIEDIESGAAALVSYRTLVAVYWRGIVWEFFPLFQHHNAARPQVCPPDGCAGGVLVPPFWHEKARL